MAIAERTTETIWEGGLARGHGTVLIQDSVMSQDITQ